MFFSDEEDEDVFMNERDGSIVVLSMNIRITRQYHETIPLSYSIYS